MKNTVFLLLLVTSSLAYSQKSDTLSKKIHFELSFGRSMLFISNSKLINAHDSAAIVLPTSAALFFYGIQN